MAEVSIGTNFLKRFKHYVLKLGFSKEFAITLTGSANTVFFSELRNFSTSFDNDSRTSGLVFDSPIKLLLLDLFLDVTPLL